MKRTAHGISKSKPFVFWVLVLVCIFLLIGFLKIWQLKKASVFNTPWRTNILLLSDPFVVVSFPKNPQEKTLFIIVPNDLLMRVPWGYGYYNLAKVADLSKQEKKPQLILETVEDALHINISASMNVNEVEKAGQFTDSEFISRLKKSISYFPAKKNLNFLNLYDQAIFWMRLKFLRPDAQQFSSISSDAASIKNVILRDNTFAKLIVEENAARFMSYSFEDDAIHTEGLLISIYNTTTTPDIAQKFTGFLTVIGGKTISTGNVKSNIERCEVATKENLRDSRTVKFLVEQFKCNWSLSQDEPTDVKVLVGKYFAERWAQNSSLLVAPN